MTKSFFVCWILCSVVMACGGKKVEDQVKAEHERADSIKMILDAALDAIDHDRSDGMLKLYEIASRDDIYSVEFSEVATIKLHQLLYYKTDLWVRSFAQLDAEGMKEFKEYVHYSGIATTHFADDTLFTVDEFRKGVITKLEAISGSKDQGELVRFLREQLKQPQ